MCRQRRTCPICQKKGLLKLSNHLADVHHLESDARQPFLKKAREMSDHVDDQEQTILLLLREIRTIQTNILRALEDQTLIKSGDRWQTLSW